MALLLVLVTATVYPLAWLVHQVVEKPGIGIGRRLAERWFPRAKRPDAAG
jgi:peptidoglycan/LPS O-acetylase OafA/YrhL